MIFARGWKVNLSGLSGYAAILKKENWKDDLNGVCGVRLIRINIFLMKNGDT